MSNELSPRQKEIVQYIANGHTVMQIAKLMGLEYGTVKGHVRKAKEKFNAKSAAHCVAIAIVRGDIKVDLALDTPLNQRPNGGN